MADYHHSHTNKPKVDGLMDKYVLDAARHDELHLLLEAMMQEWCKEHKINGGLAWLAVQNYAAMRIKMMSDNRL